MNYFVFQNNINFNEKKAQPETVLSQLIQYIIFDLVLAYNGRTHY